MAWRVLVTDGLSEDGLRLLREQAEVVESETLQAVGEYDALVIRGALKSPPKSLNNPVRISKLLAELASVLTTLTWMPPNQKG